MREREASSYLNPPSSCTQWAAVTSHLGLMRDAPQTWPIDLTWRLTCQGNSPASASWPPTIRDVLNILLPQSAKQTINQSLGWLVTACCDACSGWKFTPVLSCEVTMQMEIITSSWSETLSFCSTYRSSPRRIRLHSPAFRRILGSLYQCICCFCIYM